VQQQVQNLNRLDLEVQEATMPAAQDALQATLLKQLNRRKRRIAQVDGFLERHEQGAERFSDASADSSDDDEAALGSSTTDKAVASGAGEPSTSTPSKELQGSDIPVYRSLVAEPCMEPCHRAAEPEESEENLLDLL
jgi:hypothetical protein